MNEGLTNRAVAERFGDSLQAVGKWHRRFFERGVQGLPDELCPSRLRSYEDEKVAGRINRALQEKPANTENWSMRLMVGSEGVSKTIVHRWFSLFGIKRHLAQTFKFSTGIFSNDSLIGEEMEDFARNVFLPTTLRRICAIKSLDQCAGQTWVLR